MDEQQNQPNEASWAFTDDDNSVQQAHIESLSWSASEYITHEKSPIWFAGVTSLATVIAALIFFVTKELLASITILMVAFSAVFFSTRKPDVKQYQLSDNGLSIDGKKYEFAQFRSFSIVEEGAINSIWLRSLGRFTPMIVIYFAPPDEQAIVESLSAFLPHEQRELDPVDRLTRRMRF